MNKQYISNLNTKLTFGRYKDKSINWILENSPSYLDYISRNYENIEFDKNILIKVNSIMKRSRSNKQKIIYSRYMSSKEKQKTFKTPNAFLIQFNFINGFPKREFLHYENIMKTIKSYQKNDDYLSHDFIFQCYHEDAKKIVEENNIIGINIDDIKNLFSY